MKPTRPQHQIGGSATVVRSPATIMPRPRSTALPVSPSHHRPLPLRRLSEPAIPSRRRPERSDRRPRATAHARGYSSACVPSSRPPSPVARSQQASTRRKSSLRDTRHWIPYLRRAIPCHTAASHSMGPPASAVGVGGWLRRSVGIRLRVIWPAAPPLSSIHVLTAHSPPAVAELRTSHSLLVLVRPFPSLSGL